MEQVTDVPRFLFSLAAMLAIVFVAQVGYVSREIWMDYVRAAYQSFQRRFGRPLPAPPTTQPRTPQPVRTPQRMRRSAASRASLFRDEGRAKNQLEQEQQLAAMLAQQMVGKTAPEMDGRGNGRTDEQTDGAFQRDREVYQLQLDRTKEAVIRVLLLSGWSVEEIRSVIKGSNEHIGTLVKELRESLEIPAPIKALPAPKQQAVTSSIAKPSLVKDTLSVKTGQTPSKMPDPIVALLPDPMSENPDHLVPLRRAPDGTEYITSAKQT